MAITLGFASHCFDELRFRARADGQHPTGGSLSLQVGMSHAAVEVNRVTLLQRERCIEFAMKYDRALEHVAVLLAWVPNHVAKFFQRARMQLGNDWHESLVEKIGRRIDVMIILCLDSLSLAG